MQIVFAAFAAAIATSFAPNPVPAVPCDVFFRGMERFRRRGVALTWTGPVIIVRWPSAPGG